MGSITEQTVLRYIYENKVPISPCYGELQKLENGDYKFTLAQRSGCTLCGFGIKNEWDRFAELYKVEPAKVKYAFTPVSKGGLGYKEICEYLNKYCKCKIEIPKIS